MNNNRNLTFTDFSDIKIVKEINTGKIEELKHILDSLCTRELSNEGRKFIINRITKLGGNYSK